MRQSLTLLPRLECSGGDLGSLQPAASSVQAMLLPQLKSQLKSQIAGTIGVYHDTQLIFEFLVATGLYHVGQAGLKLVTSSDLPTSAFQSAGIIGVSHAPVPSQLLTTNQRPSKQVSRFLKHKMQAF